MRMNYQIVNVRVEKVEVVEEVGVEDGGFIWYRKKETLLFFFCIGVFFLEQLVKTPPPSPPSPPA